MRPALDEESWRSLPVRLELRDIRWSDNHARFSGTYGGWPVVVAQDGDGLTLRTRFEPPPPFESAFAADHAQRFDDVPSHHSDFDALVCVTALDWNRLAVLEVLSRAAVRAALMQLIAAGGRVDGPYITSHTLAGSASEMAKILALHDELARALVSPPVARLEGPRPPEPQPVAHKRVFECDQTYVEELPGGRLHLHVDRQFGTCAEIDGAAIQFHGGGRLPLSELTDLALANDAGYAWGRYELHARAGTRTFQLGAGEEPDMIRLAAFLRARGFPELSVATGWRALFGFPPPLPKR